MKIKFSQMEPTLEDFKEFMKEFIRNSYPNPDEFPAYFKLFVGLYKSEFVEYEIILKEKLGVDGVRGVAEIYCSMGSHVSKDADKIFERWHKVVTERLKHISGEISVDVLVNELSEFFTVEWSLENGNELYNSLADYENNMKELEEKTFNLPDNEKSLIQTFNLLFEKVWLHKIISISRQDQETKFLIKYFLERYTKGMNALYGHETVNEDLIEYIQSIEIPNEKYWRKLIEAPRKKETVEIEPPNTYIPPNHQPVFLNIPEILSVLQPYFDEVQHSALQELLKAGVNATKLAFKGNANQLADAFRQLFDNTVIIQCNKQQLIDWICRNFTYRGKNNSYVEFNARNLSDIISGNKKPCTSPIISVKRVNGVVSIILIPRKGRA